MRVGDIVHRDRRLRDVGGEHHLAHALGRPAEGARGVRWGWSDGVGIGVGVGVGVEVGGLALRVSDFEH